MKDEFKMAAKKLANIATPRKIAKINLESTRPRFKESFGINSYPSFILYE
jgi:hypothetical protein